MAGKTIVSQRNFLNEPEEPNFCSSSSTGTFLTDGNLPTTMAKRPREENIKVKIERVIFLNLNFNNKKSPDFNILAKFLDYFF